MKYSSIISCYMKRVHWLYKPLNQYRVLFTTSVLCPSFTSLVDSSLSKNQTLISVTSVNSCIVIKLIHDDVKKKSCEKGLITK